MRLPVRKIGINGEGIAYLNRKPLFVKGVFPGEMAEIEITETNARYYRGRCLRLNVSRRDRVLASCPYQKDCGGCPLMVLKYGTQLKFKKDILQEALQKYSSFNIEVNDIIGSDNTTGYRNKCSMPVVENKGKLVSAMYETGSNHPVCIDTCLLHEEKLEEVRKHVLDVLNRHHFNKYRQSDKKGIRHLMVRGLDDEYQVVIVTGNDEISDNVIKEIMENRLIVSLWQSVSTSKQTLNPLSGSLRLLYGKDSISCRIMGLETQLKPLAFFQLNRLQAEKIYEKVCELAGGSCHNGIEAYCGTGAMSLALSSRVEHVTGIDIEPSAIENARRNAENNGIGNVEFVVGDAAEKIAKLAEREHVDLLVVDPPRTGLADDLIRTILKEKISRIIYVSCNPATLARNIRDLSGSYEVSYLRGYDMFPHTQHIETLCCLEYRR